jgi:hypothetical protein
MCSLYHTQVSADDQYRTDTTDFAKKDTVLVRPNKISYVIPDRGINLFCASLIEIFQAL